MTGDFGEQEIDYEENYADQRGEGEADDSNPCNQGVENPEEVKEYEKQKIKDTQEEYEQWKEEPVQN